MLGHLRKLVSLMPDNDAKRVVGQVLHHEMLIAIARNKNIVVRTAVMRVRGEREIYVYILANSPFPSRYWMSTSSVVARESSQTSFK